MGHSTIQRDTAHERGDVRVQTRKSHALPQDPDVRIRIGQRTLKLNDADALALSECLGAVTHWEED